MSQRSARVGNFRVGSTRINYERIIHRIHIDGVYDREQSGAGAEYDTRHGEAAAVYNLEHDRVETTFAVEREPTDALVLDVQATDESDD